jgi:hypothetical protein
MNKALLSFLVFLSFSASGQVVFGVKTGVHVSNISRADLLESNGAFNFHLGGIADWRINNSSFHIQTQALYFPVGYGKSNISAVDKNGMVLGYIHSHRINYIQVPVYFLYRIDPGAGIIKIGAGPYFAFKTGDKIKLEGGESFGNGSVVPYSTNSINSTLVGIGMHLSGEWSSFVVELHSQASFTSIYEAQAGPGSTWRIINAGISIGYLFNKK